MILREDHNPRVLIMSFLCVFARKVVIQTKSAREQGVQENLWK